MQSSSPQHEHHITVTSSALTSMVVYVLSFSCYIDGCQYVAALEPSPEGGL
jgi:hypothetical protein